MGCCFCKKRRKQEYSNPPMVVPPDKVTDAVCPLTDSAGNNTPVAYKFDIRGEKGTLKFNFTPHGVPDRARIYVDGIMVYDTGCVADKATYTDVIPEGDLYTAHKVSDTPVTDQIPAYIYVENNSTIILEILSLCVGTMDLKNTVRNTAWRVTLSCPEPNSEKVDFSKSDPFEGVFHIGKARRSDGSVVSTGRRLNYTRPNT